MNMWLGISIKAIVIAILFVILFVVLTPNFLLLIPGDVKFIDFKPMKVKISALAVHAIAGVVVILAAAFLLEFVGAQVF